MEILRFAEILDKNSDSQLFGGKNIVRRTEILKSPNFSKFPLLLVMPPLNNSLSQNLKEKKKKKEKRVLCFTNYGAGKYIPCIM